ncbi:hypothetical protein [Candidatus Methanomassiliicoccus intestinalis]|uniref:Uncharacterized protein n=1 Tax=Candidatus Methanomassiliicoccus intestinalis TaxID=1406512 RepID=A0A8J8TE12_9ARCH|nr:MAG: hypothetical protein A3207_08570 [Candidatus Methanomassiliicoccus intestinalis]
MSRVSIGSNRVLVLSRRTLCDNCSADICLYKKEGERVTECEHFIPILAAYKRCSSCGEIFEVSANCMSLREDMCLRCSYRSYSRTDKLP